MTTRYLHGPEVDQVFASEDAVGAILWALADNQGTVRDVAQYDSGTDSTSVANHIQYDAFGNITGESNASVDFMYAYTGRVWDSDAELYYYRARYYDAAVGRFVSEDPISFSAGDSNLYRYVGNSPNNFVDPSGLDDDYHGPIIAPSSPGMGHAYYYYQAQQHMPPQPPPEATRIWRSLYENIEDEQERKKAKAIVDQLDLVTRNTWIYPSGWDRCGRWCEDWMRRSLEIRPFPVNWNLIEMDADRFAGLTDTHYLIIIQNTHDDNLVGVDIGTIGGGDHVFDPWDRDTMDSDVPEEVLEELYGIIEDRYDIERPDPNQTEAE